MATYFQWRFPKDRSGMVKTPEVKRVTWLCGPERVLVESAVDFIVGDLARLVRLSRQTFTMPGDEAELWAEANQYQLDSEGGRSLLVVRNADRIQNWEPLKDWVEQAKFIPSNYLLFVSDEHDFPMLPSKDKSRALQPHVQQIQQRGSVVRCAMPSGENSGETLITWVQSISPMPSQVARHLIERTGGELADIANVAAKLAVFDVVPTTAVIDVLAPARPADGFIDALTGLDKAGALTALEHVPSSEFGKALSQLDSRLTQMAVLNEELRKNRSMKDLAREGRVPVFVAQQFRDVAKHYDLRRVTQARKALALTDSAYRRGAKDAIMEALVTLW